MVTINRPHHLELQSYVRKIISTINSFKDQVDASTLEQWKTRLDWIAPGATFGRKRRGLLDVGGRILYTLFGVATSAEIYACKTMVQEALKQNTKLYHAASGMMTVIKANRNNTQSNRVAILDIEKSVQNLWETVQSNETNLLNKIAIITTQLKIESTIQLLEAHDLRNSRIQERYLSQRAALELGVLTEKLLPKRTLNTLLQKVTTPIIQALPWQWYYQHVTLKPLWAENDTLVYMASLPLVGLESYLLYRLRSFPVPSGNMTVQLRVAKTARNISNFFLI